jgi:hemoglobin
VDTQQMTDVEVYGAIGEDGFARLVRAFYVQVPTDDVLGPMYPMDDLPGAEVRLRDFLVGRFGGPMRYVEQRGHPRLRQRHAPFAIDDRARDRWIALMTRALDETALQPDADAVLRAFFDATATFMINRQQDSQFQKAGAP